MKNRKMRMIKISHETLCQITSTLSQRVIYFKSIIYLNKKCVESVINKRIFDSIFDEIYEALKKKSLSFETYFPLFQKNKKSYY